MRSSRSIAAYVVVVLLLLLAAPLAPAGTAALPMTLLWAAIGAVAVAVATRLGFPDLLDPEVSNASRLAAPLLLGIGTGALFCAAAQAGVGPDPLALPAARALGAVIHGEILDGIRFHLVPGVAAVLVVSGVLLRGGLQDETYWVLMILYALYRPVTEAIDLLKAGQVWGQEGGAATFALIFVANVLGFWFLRRAGLLALLAYRLTTGFVFNVFWPLMRT